MEKEYRLFVLVSMALVHESGHRAGFAGMQELEIMLIQWKYAVGFSKKFTDWVVLGNTLIKH